VIATIANSFTVPEIRRKILFTCVILALYRLGAHIPVPGIDFNAVKNIDNQFSGSNILGFLNLFSAPPNTASPCRCGIGWDRYSGRNFVANSLRMRQTLPRN